MCKPRRAHGPNDSHHDDHDHDHSRDGTHSLHQLEERVCTGCGCCGKPKVSASEPERPDAKQAYSLNHAMIDGEQARAAAAYAEHFGEPGYDDPSGLYIDQHYPGYSDDDQEVWRELYRKQADHLHVNASRVWLGGARAIGLGPDAIPDLAVINGNLRRLTGWQSRAVPGYVAARPFFACLSRREFPTTVVIRPKDRLEYLPEPDIFHDVFGHVPLHADPAFADFLQEYGSAALVADAEHTERLARLFWFTVEFGLIREEGRLKVYGAGLISSPGESRHCLTSPEVDRRPFDLDEVCDTAFEIDHYQPILFVLESFTQLRDAMRSYAARVREDAARELVAAR
jgi:phenylalanine-4-hydroxylase